MPQASIRSEKACLMGHTLSALRAIGLPGLIDKGLTGLHNVVTIVELPQILMLHLKVILKCHADSSPC
jgi:hypothetical protein